MEPSTRRPAKPSHEESRGATSDAEPRPSSTARHAYRRQGPDSGWGREEVATEVPLTLLVNGRELATIACSPSHREELALGFLAAEGVVDGPEAVEELYLIPEEGIAVVSAPGAARAEAQEAFGKRYVGSCCGKSRTGFYLVNDARTVRPVSGDLRLATSDCVRLMEELQRASPLFARTGGVHSAGLATRRAVEVVRSDIGRHNALDKLYGHALRAGLPLAARLVVFSGRISSEIVLKVAKMGCPVLVSKSAPTDLALELADELGVTAVGFLRGERMNVYTHPERLTDVPAG